MSKFKLLTLILCISFLFSCAELKRFLDINETRQGDIDPDLFTDDLLLDCVALSGAPTRESLRDFICAGVGIENLDGMEQFPNLRSMLINSNIIESVDLSVFPNLEFLDLSRNRLNQIDLSHNPKLVQVLLDENNFTELDTSNNPLLDVLVLSDTGISQLDLSENTELTALIIDQNGFSGDMRQGDLDLSNNTKLIDLNMFDNAITHIDLSQNKTLDKVDLRNNQLRELNVISNTNISELRINNNQIDIIDLRSLKELVTFAAENNLLEEVLLPLNEKLREVFLSNNQISCGNFNCMPGDMFEVPINENFIRLDLSNNSIESTDFLTSGLFLTELDLSGNSDLVGSFDLSRQTQLIELRVDETGITDFDFGGTISSATEVFQVFAFQVLTAINANLDQSTENLLDAMEASKDNHPVYNDPSQLSYIYETN